MTRVVLGSASTGRLKVLRQAGIEPLVIVSDVDEDGLIATLVDAPPTEVVCALAAAKADAVAADLPAAVGVDCVVIGCDSMLYIDGQLRGKPGSIEAARDQWQSIAGRSGELYTGHCVLRLRNGAVAHREIESASTTVHFGRPTQSDLAAYLDSGEPLGVAGAFTLDGLGGWFIDRIDGDPSNIVGISLAVVRVMLARAGVSIAAAWAANPA